MENAMGVCPDALLNAVIQDLASNAGGGNATCDLACNILQRTLLKKYARKVPGIDPTERALDGFLSRATFCRLIQRRPSFAIGFLHRALGYIEDRSEDIADGVRYSSGSSLGMPLRSTSGYAKHNIGRITVSSEELFVEYANLLRETNFPLWRDFLVREHKEGHVVTPHSRIVTVPKTYEIDRVIAVEPTVNGFMQQGVKAALERVLVRVGIDLKTQPGHNRALARKGSLGQGLATIDLSNASDSISWRLLKLLLPADWYDYCKLVSASGFQCRGVEYENTEIALTMGNAITFPMQTLIFLALAYEVYSRRGLKFSVNENVAVFGDDIIVLDEVYDDMCALLLDLGFEPNPEKSFGSGPFRESCGADWYNGVNVRGVYIKALRTVADHFVARNLLAAWSYRWGIGLPQSIGLIDTWLLVRKRWTLVPPSASIDSGVRVFDPPAGSYRNWSYHYKAWRTSFKGRKAPRLHDGAILQGLLSGYISDGLLCERPVVKGKSRLESATVPLGVWHLPVEADAWLYDESCTSASL